MADTRDTFSAWLELLADTLDEPELTGAQVAGRLHLSRFHLGRIVRASAGEAPSALRRRILLERSAFRLATSTRPVLDVAASGTGPRSTSTRRAASGSRPSRESFPWTSSRRWSSTTSG